MLQRTISLSETPSQATIAVIVHTLNHHAVSLEVLPNVVTVTPLTSIPASVLYPVDLLLSSICRLLRFLELLPQRFDLAVLFRVARLLFVRFAPVVDTFPKTHRRCKCTDKRGGQRGHDEGLLSTILVVILGTMQSRVTFSFFSSIHDA
jgi:hypothetical protein